MVIGFLVGLGSMYYYLHYGAEVRAHADDWFRDVAGGFVRRVAEPTAPRSGRP